MWSELMDCFLFHLQSTDKSVKWTDQFMMMVKYSTHPMDVDCGELAVVLSKIARGKHRILKFSNDISLSLSLLPLPPSLPSSLYSECLDGNYTCFVEYSIAAGSEISDQDKNNFINELMQIFIYQSNYGDHIQADIRHIRKFHIDGKLSRSIINLKKLQTFCSQ